jgi:hypothetical protein
LNSPLPQVSFRAFSEKENSFPVLFPAWFVRSSHLLQEAFDTCL